LERGEAFWKFIRLVHAVIEMSESSQSFEAKVALLNDDESKPAFHVYPYRWVVLILYVLAAMANGMILPTWYAITEKANDFWGGIGITAINLFNVMFNIMSLPGTALALRVSEKNGPRYVLLCGACLTTTGCLMRVIGAELIDQIGGNGSYTVVLLGSALVGLSQPFYINMPAKITTMWFAVNERDLTMAFCTITMIIGKTHSFRSKNHFIDKVFIQLQLYPLVHFFLHY
jgi:hypothetical protein